METQQEIILDKFWQEIDRYFGIQPNTSKNTMILDLVEERCQYHGLSDVPEYLGVFTSSEFPESEYEFWAEHLTVNETYFFRNEGDWSALRDTIIPELISLRQDECTLRVLSLGASSGEEPYTLALMLRHDFPELRRWTIQIDATDIHQGLLDKAKRGGPYSTRSVKNIPDEIKEKDMQYDGRGWFVNDEIVSKVNFLYANLFSMPVSIKISTYDIVFCRNVVIYFKKDVASGLIKTIFGYLRDGGYLIIGHSEGSIADDAGLKPADLPGSLSYQRSGKTNGAVKRYKPAADPSYLATAAGYGNTNGNIVVKSWVSTETHIERAKKAIEDGDLEFASTELQALLMREPFNAEAHYFTGVIHQNMGDLGKSLAAFEKVTKIDPDFAMGYFQAAMLCQRVRNYPHARMYYNALVNLLNKYEPEAILEGSADVTAGFARMICHRFLNNHS